MKKPWKIAELRNKIEQENDSSISLLKKCNLLFERCEKIFKTLQEMMSAKQVLEDPKEFLAVVADYQTQNQKIFNLRSQYFSASLPPSSPSIAKEEEKMNKIPEDLKQRLSKLAQFFFSNDHASIVSAMNELQTHHPAAFKHINEKALKSSSSGFSNETELSTERAGCLYREAVFRTIGAIISTIRNTGTYNFPGE